MSDKRYVFNTEVEPPEFLGQYLRTEESAVFYQPPDWAIDSSMHEQPWTLEDCVEVRPLDTHETIELARRQQEFSDSRPDTQMGMSL